MCQRDSVHQTGLVCPSALAVLVASVPGVEADKQKFVILTSQCPQITTKTFTERSYLLLFWLFWGVMGCTQSYIVASLCVCSVYLGYVHIYCSYKLLKTNVLSGDNLPSFLYLYIKFWTRALTRRSGCLCATPTTREAVYTVLKCRWTSSSEGSFCVFLTVWKLGDFLCVSLPGWRLLCSGGSAVLQAMVGIILTLSSETSRCASQSCSVTDSCSWCSLMKTSGSAQQVRHPSNAYLF